MTLKEFALYHRGYMQHVDGQLDMLAWHAAAILNAWTKKRIRPSDLRQKPARGKAAAAILTAAFGDGKPKTTEDRKKEFIAEMNKRAKGG